MSKPLLNGLIMILLLSLCCSCSINIEESNYSTSPDTVLKVETAEKEAEKPTKSTHTNGIIGNRDEDTLSEEHLIDVPAMSQYPEYVNGCEITSLAMLSNYLKLPYDRQELIKMLAMDETPRQHGQDGSIEVWGDPDQGFVGDITGSEMGYGVYHKPIRDLLAHIYNDHSVDMTGNEFSEIEKQVAREHPVIIWTTSNFTPSNDWVEWNTKDGRTIHATFDEHAVLLVGYDEDYVYVNNPMNGKKAEKIAKQPFIESWEQLGKQAVTYVP